MWASVGAWGGRGQCEAITGHPFHSPRGSKASEQSKAGWKDKDGDDDDTVIRKTDIRMTKVNESNTRL